MGMLSQAAILFHDLLTFENSRKWFFGFPSPQPLESVHKLGEKIIDENKANLFTVPNDSMIQVIPCKGPLGMTAYVHNPSTEHFKVYIFTFPLRTPACHLAKSTPRVVSGQGQSAQSGMLENLHKEMSDDGQPIATYPPPPRPRALSQNNGEQ